MMRFFVEKQEGKYFILSKEVLNHIKVSRVENKKFICVYQKKFYECILENKMAKIIEIINENHEFKREVILAAAIIKTKRFEWLIQKATELGATKLIPLYTDYVEQKMGNDIEKKLQRWNEIAKSAAEQSFRNVTMEVVFPQKFDEIIKQNNIEKFLAHEKQELNSKWSSFFPTNSIFFVGPEGGFSEREINLALENQTKIISLGKRILRAETASIYLLSRIEEE